MERDHVIAPGMVYDAFLSYGRGDDEAFVKKLREDLAAHGFRIWWDRADMQNRALTFLQVIRDQIDRSERLIAVVGPAALASDYVRAEWEHARLFAKGLIAIPRLSGYEAMPRDLARYHGPDFREDARYPEALGELMRLLREPVAPLGPLAGVPALPAYFVPPVADLEALQDLVLADIRRAVALPANERVFAVVGMPGSGKSVLAAAFARSAETRRAFHRDGIVWASIGQRPRLMDVARAIGAAFDQDVGRDTAIAFAKLQRLLADRACLIVLDDVWDVSHVEQTASAIGERVRLLITTRNEDTASALAPRRLLLRRPDDELALRMLEAYSGQWSADWPQDALEVQHECGNLPFALALSGSMARAGTPWADLRDALKEADLHYVEETLPGYGYRDLLRAQHASVTHLEAEEPGATERYLDLVVFPDDEQIPEAAVLTLWSASGVTGRAARKLLVTLAQKSLIQLNGSAPSRIVSMHDLQHDFLRATVPDLNVRHRRVLDAYGAVCGGAWSRGPDDGYFFQHLARHMLGAAGAGELGRLLFDFEWLQAKLDRLGIVAVLEDFALDPDERSALRFLEDVLRRSALTLHADADQLAGQILARVGRFRMEDQLDHLVAGARAWRGRPWLRPLNGTLEMPGSALRATLAGHEGTPRSVAITPDGKWGASAGNSQPDRSVRVWDLDKGVLARILVDQAEAGACTPLAFMPDGRVLLSAYGAVIRAWEIGTGKLLFSLEKHEARVRALAIDDAGQRLLSSSEDGVMVLWDFATRSGEIIATDEEAADAIALSSIGHHAAVRSASAVALWDLAKRKGERLEVGPEAVREPAWMPPSLALSASTDTVYFGSPLREWTPRTGELRIAMDPQARVLAVASREADVALVTPDGETLEIWDRVGNRVRPRIDLPNQLAQISCATLTPDGKRALVGYRDHLVKAWDVGIVPPLGVNRGGNPDRAEARRIDVCADGRYAVIVRASGQESVWDLDSGECWNHPVLHQGVLGEAQERRMAERDLTDRWGALCAPVTAEGGVDAQNVCVSTERWSVTAVHADCAIAIREAMEKTGEYLEPDAPPEYSGQYALRLYRRVNGSSPPDVLRGHGLPVLAVAISDDGRIAVSGGVGRTLRVWDLASATQKHILKGHRDTIRKVALSHAGRIAASASDDRTVRVWDLSAGRLLATFTGELRMKSCALSADGKKVIAGEGGGKIHVLRLETP